MDNKDLNENITNVPKTDFPENTEHNTTESTEAVETTVINDVQENVTDSSNGADGEQNEYNPVFSENITDDLLSEIFDDDTNKKKKKKKSTKHQVYAKPKEDAVSTEKKKSFLSELFDWVEIIVLSAAFVLVLFTFVMRLAVVDGPSMENTLHHDEMLIISGLLYTPENNDIIVFNSPNFREPIVKRIIATEGQTVDIDFETWTVIVDGKALQEDYVKKDLAPMKRSDIQFPLTVPDGHVFVMGDNRNDSLDSRSSLIGLVDERYILGEVKLRLTPFSKFGKVN